MPRVFLKKIERYLKTASRVCLSGVGEPTLAPNFSEILKVAPHGSDRSLWMNSNGHFMSDERIQEVLHSGFSEINFSLDAATPETYRKIRGSDFSEVLDGISRLLAARRKRSRNKLEICINMTLMRENLPEVEAFVVLGKSLGVDTIVFSQLYAFGDNQDWRVQRGGWTFVYSDQMLNRCPDEARRYLKKAKAMAENLSIPIDYQGNVASYL
jgi:MoaA/NifB/PqqE/SkfB family radical SAM enzyme